MSIGTIKGTVLVVIEQKGSDPDECQERFLAGCEIFKTIQAGRPERITHLLIVGGANNGNSPETIRSWCPEELLGLLVIDNRAANTHEKAVSILNYSIAHNIDTIIQVTSLYHSLRAFLSTLRILKEHSSHITFLNYVADSHDSDTIAFALHDEFFLAKAIDANISFTPTASDIKRYTQSAGAAKVDDGFTKYLNKRFAEARRIVEYSEIGKDHIMTHIDLPEVINSYLTV